MTRIELVIPTLLLLAAFAFVPMLRSSNAMYEGGSLPAGASFETQVVARLVEHIEYLEPAERCWLEMEFDCDCVGGEWVNCTTGYLELLPTIGTLLEAMQQCVLCPDEFTFWPLSLRETGQGDVYLMRGKRDADGKPIIKCSLPVWVPDWTQWVIWPAEIYDEPPLIPCVCDPCE